MSDLNVSLVLRLIDRATAPARAAMANIERLGNRSEQIGRNGLAWSNRQLEASQNRRRALRGEVMELAGMGLAIYGLMRPAIAFEAQMAEVSKVVDFRRPEGLRLLGQDILALTTSGGLPMAAEGIADIVAAAAQANLVDAMLPDEEKRRQLVAFAEDAAMMGVAFDMGASEAGQAMATWRTQLRLDQEQALLLGDAVNHLSNNMNAQAPAVVDVIERTGALAKSAGLATNEIAALSAAFVSAAPSPEIAATAMKRFIGAMVGGEAATDRQANVLARLGFDAGELAQRMQVDAKGAIIEVMEALAELPAYEQNSSLKMLFGEEAIGAIAPLLTNLDNLRGAFALVADETRYSGAMTEEYLRAVATTQAQITLLRNRTYQLSVTLGESLLPILNEMITTIGPLVDRFSQWAADNPKLVKTIGWVVVGLIAMKASGLALRFLFEGLVLVFIRFHRVLMLMMIGVGRALIWLGRVAMANPIGFAITALAALAYAVYDNWADIVAYVTEKIETVRQAFDEGLLNGILVTLAEFNPFRLMLDSLQGLIAYVMELLGVPDEIVSAFADIDLWDAGVAMIQSLWNGASSLVQTMVDAISAKLAAIMPQWMKDGWEWSEGHGAATASRINQLAARPGGNAVGPPLGQRALGGPVRAGFLYEINERGQEFFRPDRDGHVIPAGKLRGAMGAAIGGGGRAFSVGDINIYAAPGMSTGDVASAVRRELERLAAEAGAALHDGGAF